MFAIVGATGKVGHSTSLALREAGAPVRAVVRDAAKAGPLQAIGCEVVVADLQDASALAQAIAGARTVQIILPPPPQAVDAPGEMQHSIESLAHALEQGRPSRVLAISDYGAHVGVFVGMPSLFHALEERLRGLSIPKVFLRSAEQMEGWGAFIPVALASGVLPSLHHPVEMPFPTVAARDVGLIAAELLLAESPTNGEHIVHVEGPSRYSAADVAAALTELLGRKVSAQPLPRAQWQQTLERGLSLSAARLLVDLYDAHNKGGLIDVETDKGMIRRGATTIVEALRPLVPAAAK